MKYNIVIENVQVVDRNCESYNIGIDKGNIQVITRAAIGTYRKGCRIDGTGMLAFPGFINIHSHFREDPSHEWDYKSTFATQSLACLNGGITTAFNMPNTPKAPLTLPIYQQTKNLALNKPIDIFQYAAVAPSNFDQLQVLSKAGVDGFKLFTLSVGGLNMDWPQIYQALDLLMDVPQPVTIHCEDPEVLKQYENEATHCRKRPPEAEVSAIKKILKHVSGRRPINIAHVSTKGGIDLCHNYDWVTMEVTPHHLLLDKQWANLYPNNSNVNPPLRSLEHVNYLRKAVKKGLVTFYANDDAPHSKYEKANGASGLNSADVYGMTVAELLWGSDFGVDVQTIANMCCRNPAKFMGLTDRGRVDIGMKADIVLLKRGETTVKKDMLYTQNKVCPYEGMTFNGNVDTVIKNGAVVKTGGRMVLPVEAGEN